MLITVRMKSIRKPRDKHTAGYIIIFIIICIPFLGYKCRVHEVVFKV